MDVIVVGGSVTGASVAFHLVQAGVRVTLLDAGSPGWGSSEAVPNTFPFRSTDKPAWASASSKEHRLEGNSSENEIDYTKESEFTPFISGSAVLSKTPVIKQSVTMFASTVREFIRNHGKTGTRHYLAGAAKGIEMQKRLARQVLPNYDQNLHECGSQYLARSADVAELQWEYGVLKDVGACVEWMDEEQVVAHHGRPAGFAAGIFFPRDCVINSALYAQCLLDAANATGLLEVRLGVRVVDVVDALQDGARVAVVTLADGHVMHAKYAVVCTGGHFFTAALNGILRPCWSYVAALDDPRLFEPAPRRSGGGQLTFPNSPNYFTYGFTHDWCMTDGRLRVSGEDHTSGLKPPLAARRVESLLDWCLERYPYLRTCYKGAASVEAIYGVYSDTPDAAPLVGFFHADSRVCYSVGCNAWGQAIFSYAATLVPALLGLRPFTPEDAAFARHFSPGRFVHSPATGSKL
mmetsp:Transcript_53294/g.133791  ORF Transcript_53294/g.133791 Transcript_53294/m.133791 type:complete len:464 (-) Transcript_53294:69-1460(-)